MSMTKKDYELIAEVLKFTKPHVNESQDDSAYVTWQWVAYSMTATLQENNPKFDTDRFLAACGIKESQ